MLLLRVRVTAARPNWPSLVRVHQAWCLGTREFEDRISFDAPEHVLAFDNAGDDPERGGLRASRR
jgi:hypothetical protein